MLANWYWNSNSHKSFGDFMKLIEILKSPQFAAEDVKEANWAKMFKMLGANKQDLDEQADWIDDDGWRITPVTLQVPFHRQMKNSGVEEYVAGRVYHRDILSVIKERLTDTDNPIPFHLHGHELLWQPDPDSPPIQVQGELYTSDAFREVEQEVQSLNPDCKLEKVVVALMVWSDATQLTSFGGATLWPCYMAFGNESKYLRSKPSAHLCHHIAYFESVSITRVLRLTKFSQLTRLVMYSSPTASKTI
jgi:hypothetical protein